MTVPSQPSNGKQMHQGRKTDRQSNLLSGAQRFKLWQELQAARNELDAMRATFPEAAQMMTQRLGFVVTKSNIRDACHQGIVAWTRRSDRGGVSTNAAAKLNDHEARILALEDMVHRLCVELGMRQTN